MTPLCFNPAAVDEQYGGDLNAPAAVKTATDKMFDPGKAHPKAEETVKNSGVKRWRLLGG